MVRKLQRASFSHKLRDMNANFEYFEEMRTKLQTESQLKIASAWRNYYAVKQAKIEVERRR